MPWAPAPRWVQVPVPHTDLLQLPSPQRRDPRVPLRLPGDPACTSRRGCRLGRALRAALRVCVSTSPQQFRSNSSPQKLLTGFAVSSNGCRAKLSGASAPPEAGGAFGRIRACLTAALSGCEATRDGSGWSTVVTRAWAAQKEDRNAVSVVLSAS